MTAELRQDSVSVDERYIAFARGARHPETARAADATERIAVALERLAGSKKLPPPQSRIHVPPARRSL